MFGIGPFEMLTEFKKGMQELENEVKTSIYSEPTTTRSAYQDRLPSPPVAHPAEPAPPAAVEPPPSETINS
jgi:hypothetical protein